MRRDRLTLLALMLAALACNFPIGIPVTPTLQPTRIVSSTPTESPTAIALLPTPTPTETPTETPPPSLTPSASATETPTATSTATSTATATGLPTATATLIPSETPVPSETTTLVPTDTPPPTARASDTPAPTATATSSSTLVTPTNTQPPRDLGILPTLVPAPPTLVPTLDLPATPVPGTRPAPTRRAVTPAFTSVVGRPASWTPVRIGGIAPQPPSFGADLRLGRSADVSARGDRAVIDASGRLTINNQPFTAHIPRAEMRFTHVRWSPNGRWLAFVVEVPNAQSDPPDSLRIIDDGLWVLDTTTNTAYFVYRQIYDNPHDSPQVRMIDDIVWAPDNDAILVTLRRHRGKASVLVGVGGAMANPSQYANETARLELRNYSAGAALPDNQGFVVTTSAPGESARLGIVYRDGRFEQVADGVALGLWIQNAARLPDGRFAFLGKPSPTGRLEDSTGALRLYVMPPGGSPVVASGILPGEVLYAAWNLNARTLSVWMQNGQRFDLRP